MFKVIAFVLALVTGEAHGAVAGKVVFLRGLAKADGRILTVGATVEAGQKITTGGSSTLRLLLGDHTAVQVGPASELTVEAPEPEKLTLSLLYGKVHSLVRKLSGSGHSFEVKTSDGVMGVRGTSFFVKKPQAGPTSVCVCHGKVAISGKDFESKAHENVFDLRTGSLKRIRDLSKDHNPSDKMALARVLDSIGVLE